MSRIHIVRILFCICCIDRSNRTGIWHQSQNRPPPNHIINEAAKSFGKTKKKSRHRIELGSFQQIGKNTTAALFFDVMSLNENTVHIVIVFSAVVAA